LCLEDLLHRLAAATGLLLWHELSLC
jgi:hypothetical protein